MSLRLQKGILIALGIVAAIWAGAMLANESYFLPTLFAGIAVLGIVAWWRVRYDAALVAFALFGYIVGNRGFAQLMLIPQFPLLVAELVMGLSLVALLFTSAVTQRLPFRKDALNMAVLLWILVGAVRLVVDVRVHGFTALRDSAMCYYALFFFIGQSLGGETKGRRWLHGALLASLAVLPVTFAVWSAWPEIFMRHLLFRGVPLVLYKADLAATMLAGGVFYFFFWAEKGYRAAWLAVAACFVIAVLPLTRAALLGLAIGIGWHVVSGRWRLLRTLLMVALAGAAIDAGGTLLRRESLSSARSVQIAQYAASILPFADARAIELKTGDVKGNPVDNNLFRLVWWQTIIEETWHERPFFGLGFGHDLASQFLVEYGLIGDTEFTARSPHSILVSSFGRAGLVGASVFLFLIGSLVTKTFRTALQWRRDDRFSEPMALWGMCWVVLISACFGVVLEGPMGAVVFWTVLGLANALADAKADPEPTAAPESSDPLLHASKPGDELASAS